MAEDQQYTISIVAKNATKEAFAEAKRDAEALAESLGGTVRSSIKGGAEAGSAALQSFSIQTKNVSQQAFEQARKDAEALADRLGGTAGYSIRTGATAGSAALNMFKGALGALGVQFSLQSIVGFAKDLLDTGDQLVRVADQTGLTTEEVQRLQYIAGQSGNSLDQMTGAVSKLQRNLAGGDEGAVAAVKKLGLNFNELRTASPYDAMASIATAFANISDPAAKAKLATELFGKSGAEIIPSLTAEFKKLGDEAPVMSDKTARALDSAGDQLARFGTQIKVWAAESYNFAGKLFDGIIKFVYQALADWLNWSAKFFEITAKIPGASKVLDTLGVSTKGLREQALWFTDAAKAQAAQMNAVEVAVRKAAPAILDVSDADKKAAADAKKHAEELAKLTGKVHELEAGFFQVPEALTKIGRAYDESKLGTMAAEVAKIERSAYVANFGFKGMTEGLETLGTKVTTSDEELTHLLTSFAFIGPTLDQAKVKTVSFFDQFKTAVGGLNDIFQRAFEGGGGVGGAITSFATNIGKSLLNAIPVIGPFISQFAGAIVAGVKRLFGGPSQQELQGRQVEGSFEQSFGGFKSMMDAIGKAYEATGRSAAQAQQDVLAMLNAEKQGAEATKAAIDKINEAFTEQQQDAADLDAAIQRYGFSIEQLGPTLQKQRLDEQALQLLNDWRLLVGAGIDVTVVDEKMASSMQEYLNTARATGQEVPIAMQPILQKMIEQGLLTDANGNKITDMKDLGVSFAETMTQGFDKVVAKLDQLLQKIGVAIPDAISKVPRSVDVDVNVNGRWNIPDFPRDEVPAFPTEAYVRRPTLAIVGDVPGGEFVLKPSTVQRLVDRASALGAQAAGAGGSAVPDMEPLRREIGRMRNDLRTLGDSIQRGVRDGVLAAR